MGPFFLLISFFLSLISGFRNTIAKFFLIGLIGLWQSFRVYSFFLILPALTILGLFLWSHGKLFELPRSVQRSLTWLPGDWDPSVKNATEGSSKFRVNLRRVYMSEFFRSTNLLGEGYLYRREDLLLSQESFWRRAGFTIEMDEDESIRGYIIRRSHLGTIVWAVFSMLVLIKCLPFILFQQVNPRTSTSHFGAILMVIAIIGFWFLFGSLRAVITEIAAFAFCFTIGSQRPVPDTGALS